MPKGTNPQFLSATVKISRKYRAGLSARTTLRVVYKFIHRVIHSLWKSKSLPWGQG
jgi:hypothetical protein